MTSRLEHITQQRLDSLNRIRARGLNPYPHSYHPSHTTKEAATFFLEHEATALQSNVSLAGRITAKRPMGKIVFFDIRDGSGRIQLCFRYDSLGQKGFELLDELDIGDIIGAEG